MTSDSSNQSLDSSNQSLNSSNQSPEPIPPFVSLNEKLQNKKIQDQDQEKYDIIHESGENEIIQNSKTNSFDQKTISTILHESELKDTPMSCTMVCPPEPFQTPPLDKYYT